MVDESTDQGIPAPEGEVEIIETDYEIGQDNIEPVLLELCNGFIPILSSGDLITFLLKNFPKQKDHFLFIVDY